MEYKDTSDTYYSGYSETLLEDENKYDIEYDQNNMDQDPTSVTPSDWLFDPPCIIGTMVFYTKSDFDRSNKEIVSYLEENKLSGFLGFLPMLMESMSQDEFLMIYNICTSADSIFDLPMDIGLTPTEMVLNSLDNFDMDELIEAMDLDDDDLEVTANIMPPDPYVNHHISMVSTVMPAFAPQFYNSLPTELVLVRTLRRGIKNKCASVGSWRDFALDASFALADKIPHKPMQYYIDNPGADNLFLNKNRVIQRPVNTSPVLIVWPDGRQVNIGAHGLTITSNIHVPLNFDTIYNSIDEFTSAQAGEGLACATPSHDLHQWVNAIFSNAIASAALNVVVEPGDCDFEIQYPDKTIKCEITSSSGIWDKPIRKRSLVCISKYDAAASLAGIPDADIRDLIIHMICNSLAVESPHIYHGILEPSAKSDLQVQEAIFQRLASRSQQAITSLSRIASKAMDSLMHETYSANCNIVQGRPYTEKINILLETINNLEKPINIALPPFVHGDITPIHDIPLKINVLDATLICPGVIGQTSRDYQKMEVLDTKNFCNKFPASGIMPYGEATKVITHILKSMPVIASGGNIGPQTPDPDAVTQFIDTWYQTSVIAQYAEIMRDVALSIQKGPQTTIDQWCSTMIMNKRIILFYHIRDPVNSPSGFRIDWFAISSCSAINAIPIAESGGQTLYIWPRQKLRSSELDSLITLPHRIKLTLYSILSKIRGGKEHVIQALKLATYLMFTTLCATWTTAEVLLPMKYLVDAMACPSSPFHELGKKFKKPKTAACCAFYIVLSDSLSGWQTRNKYNNITPLFRISRNFEQIESYLYTWAPSDFASQNDSLLYCMLDLYQEHVAMDQTLESRLQDLTKQLTLITQDVITSDQIKESMRASLQINIGDVHPWNVFGALSSAYSLSRQSSPQKFDQRFARGEASTRFVDHLTVRHSFKIRNGILEPSLVCQSILSSSSDPFLTASRARFLFYYVNTPVFLNHPKKGEAKKREISIADPSTRICLNEAEKIAGSYGKTTSLEYLKVPAKNAVFFHTSTRVLSNGGSVMWTDSKRFGPNLSNYMISCCFLALSAIGGSSHLKSAACVYRRMASRRMTVSSETINEIQRLQQKNINNPLHAEFTHWYSTLPSLPLNGEIIYKYYCDAHHCGQGMSHCGSSVLVSGAMKSITNFCDKMEYNWNHVPIPITGISMITSDDQTLLASYDDHSVLSAVPRQVKQKASQTYIRIFRIARESVMPAICVRANLSKEFISSTRAGFNSLVNGIGQNAPLQGFREMITQLTIPQGLSLISDILNAAAFARNIVSNGQGFKTGSYGHLLAIDLIKTRWSITKQEFNYLASGLPSLLPEQLLLGLKGPELLNSPDSLLPEASYNKLMSIATDHAEQMTELQIYGQEGPFTPLGHITLPARRQHQNAISEIRNRVNILKNRNLNNTAMMLEQCLSKLISSARTRGIGRVGLRIKGKMIQPRDYGTHSFNKAPLLETTLAWYKYLNDLIQSPIQHRPFNRPANIILAPLLSNIQPGLTSLVRSRKNDVEIPKYIIAEAQITPFGQHAVVRGKLVQIPKITVQMRREYNDLIWLRESGAIREHTVYNDLFPVSWSPARGGQLISYRPDETHLKTGKQVQWGLFEPINISYLSECARQHDVPILALSGIHDNMAYFHGTSDMANYYCAIASDSVPVVGGSVTKSLGGTNVVLVNQGSSTMPRWMPPGVVDQEVETLANIRYSDCYEAIINDNWHKNHGVTIALGATIVDETLYYIPAMNPPKFIQRKKAVLNMSMGGYWYYRHDGVAIRTVLKGLYYRNMHWSFPTLGWRASLKDQLPMIVETPQVNAVSEFVTLGSVADESLMVDYTIAPGTHGIRVVQGAWSATLRYSRRLERDRFKDIMRHNKHLGSTDHRFPNQPLASGFVQLGMSVQVTGEAAMDSQTFMQAIEPVSDVEVY